MKVVIVLLSLIAVTPSVQATAGAPDVRTTDHLTVPQWVNPAVAGELKGRLILPSTKGTSEAVANATMVITDGSGKSIRTQSDDRGHFLFKGVRPGVYALSARGDGVFACCAMHVVPGDMPSAEVLPREVEVAAAAIDYSIIKTSIVRYLPPVKEQTSLSLAAADLKTLASRVAGPDFFRVLQSDGGLKGRINIAGAKGKSLGQAGLMNIFLIRKNTVVDRIVSAKDGSFGFGSVAPGEYSILALGQSGIGMAGFELVDPADAAAAQAAVAANGQTLTTSSPCCNCCSGFSMQIAPLPQAVACCEQVIMEEPVAATETVDPNAVAVDEFGNPIGGVDQFGNPVGGGFGDPGFTGAGAGGGGAGGGGVGGGGGGFGGGGLGGLAALGGLGALAGLGGGGNGGALLPNAAASPAN